LFDLDQSSFKGEFRSIGFPLYGALQVAETIAIFKKEG
jgi:hypothetical protein